MLKLLTIQERTERIMALHYGDTTMQTDIRQDGALSHGTTGQHTIQAAILWGLLFGGMQAASPLLI
jgi:hypothetical protein